jgi:hypothetical protein
MIDIETARTNNYAFLNTVIDVSKTVEFLLLYVETSKDINTTQHEEILKRVIQKHNEEQNDDR